MKELIAAWVIVSGAWSSFLMGWIGWQLVQSGAFNQESRLSPTRQVIHRITDSTDAPEPVSTPTNASQPEPTSKKKTISPAALAALQAQSSIPKVEFKLPVPGEEWSGEMIFETRCIVCHSLEVPKAQKLDRQTWSWVVGEMQKKYHVPLSAEEKEKLLDFVASSYGPESP